MKNSQVSLVIALASCAILVLGVFSPLMKMPIVGSVNYFQNGKGDGVIVLALAGIALILALRNKLKALYILGAMTMAVLLFTFIKMQSAMSDYQNSIESLLKNNPFGGMVKGLAQSMQMDWGWALLVAGAMGLVVAAQLAPAPILETPPVTTPAPTTRTTVWIWVVITSLVLTVLYLMALAFEWGF